MKNAEYIKPRDVVKKSKAIGLWAHRVEDGARSFWRIQVGFGPSFKNTKRLGKLLAELGVLYSTTPTAPYKKFGNARLMWVSGALGEATASEGEALYQAVLAAITAAAL